MLPTRFGQSTAFKKDQVDAGPGYNASQVRQRKALALNRQKGTRTRPNRYIIADRKEHSDQSIPATLHQPEIFFSAFGPEHIAKAERMNQADVDR